MNDTLPDSAWTPVPILMYHDLELKPRERKYKHFYVTLRDFEWQIRSLHRAGFTPITFQQLGEARSGQKPLPEKPILLTFDDGYKNVLKLAAPVLHECSMPFTVFIVTGKIGQTNDWVIEEGYDTSPLMDWKEIHELRSSGLADIQPHTVTHRRLSRLSPAELRGELADSKKSTEDELGQEMLTICYPYGDFSQAVLDASAAAGYKYGVTTQFGRVRRDDPLLALPRVSIHYVPPLSFDYGVASMNFWWKVKSRVDRRP